MTTHPRTARKRARARSLARDLGLEARIDILLLADSDVKYPTTVHCGSGTMNRENVANHTDGERTYTCRSEQESCKKETKNAARITLRKKQQQQTATVTDSTRRLAIRMHACPCGVRRAGQTRQGGKHHSASVEYGVRGVAREERMIRGGVMGTSIRIR